MIFNNILEAFPPMSDSSPNDGCVLCVLSAYGNRADVAGCVLANQGRTSVWCRGGRDETLNGFSFLFLE